jgi:hypothetical protein
MVRFRSGYTGRINSRAIASDNWLAGGIAAG